MAIGILVGWGLLELFPGSLERDYRLPYAANRVVAFAGVDADAFDGQHPHVFVNAAARPVRRAGADGRRNRAVPVAARGERTHRRGRVSHPRPAGAVRARTTHSATSPPAATSRWCSRRTAARRSPTASRWASALPAVIPSATRSRGRRRSRRGCGCARTYGWAPGVMGASSAAAQAFREAGLNALRTRRRGDPVSRQLPALRSRHEAGPSGRDARTARRAHRADPPPPRHLDRRDGHCHQAGRLLARHRDRARLLDGAGPTRRSRRR